MSKLLVLKWLRGAGNAIGVVLSFFALASIVLGAAAGTYFAVMGLIHLF